MNFNCYVSPCDVSTRHIPGAHATGFASAMSGWLGSHSSLRRDNQVGQLPGRNKLKASSRLLVSPFPEIKFIPSCCGVL
jgi:hypothetical protein